jgi:adenylylsulfate kinase
MGFWKTFVDTWALNSTETALRSLVKAYSYRCCGTLTTIIISYSFTGRLVISLGIGATEMVIKPFIYWLHERVWSRVKFGKK